MPRRTPWPAAAAVVLTLASSASRCRAGELQLTGSAGGEASSWRGDGAAFSSIKLGFRFADLVAPYFMFRLGYGAVDQRMLTHLSLGAQIWGRIGGARPYLRVGAVHQHEESSAALQQDPFGALFGVGDGIRHRAGLDVGAGCDVPFYKHGKSFQLFASVEGLFTWFPDPRGPNVYGGGELGVGFNYGL